MNIFKVIAWRHNMLAQKVALKKEKNHKQAFSLSGKFCPGRKWREENEIEFCWTIFASNQNHAKRIALGRLKAFCCRKREEVGLRKFLLKDVFLKREEIKIRLFGYLHNTSILFAKRARLIWH